MPAAAAAAVVGAIGLTATAATVATAIITVGFSVGLSFVANKLLAKKPNTNVGMKGRTVTVREPIQPRPIIYGETRVGGTIVFMATSESPDGTTNGTLHMVIALAGHECEEIGDIYFDDYRVPLGPNGWATSGRYYDGEGDVQTYVRVEKHLGAADQAASAALVNANVGWTSAHRLRGIAYLYVRLIYNTNMFPNGVPNISAVVRGKKVYDPATDVTEWSINPALCIRDYLTDSTYGLGCTADEIDDDLIIAAANACSEMVPLASGGTEQRYKTHGAFDTDTPPRDIIPALLSAMAGRAIWSGGKWRVFAGVAQTPVVTLDESDLRAGFRTVNRVSRRELFNAVKGTHVSRENKYQPADFPPITNSTYEAQDGGERIWKDTELIFTRDPSTAQRIAKIDLERMRQQITIPKLPCKLTAFRVRAGDTIRLTNARKGWDEKLFEVTSWQLVVEGDDDAPLIGVDLELRETADEVWDWDSGEETVVDPAPDTNLPDPFEVPAPTNLTLDSGDDQLFITTSGEVVSRIYATWIAADDAFAERPEIAWKKSSASTWSNGQVLPADTTDFHISPVEDGIAYDVRVRSINVLGIRSAWLEVSNHVVIGKTAPPPDVESFLVTRMADGTRLCSWKLDNPPADVRAGGGYRICYSLDTEAAWADMTPLHTGVLKASPYETNELAAGTYRFGAVAVDSTGNESENPLFIEATLGDPRLRSVLVQRFEHALGWPGTITDGYVDDDVLHISSLGWAGLPATWAALEATWSAIVTDADELIYETPVIDVGIDASFTPLVTAIANGTVTQEMRTGTDADGSVTGSYGAISTVFGKRYIQFRISVTGPGSSLSALTIVLDAETEIQDFEDVNTATHSASWFERVAAGHVKIGARTNNMAAISSAQITALQSVGAGWSWVLVSKSETVDGKPAAELKIYDSTGTLADALIDVTLKGPKV